MKPVPENPKLKTTDVSVFFGTWNVNSISPPSSLSEWLGSNFASSKYGYPDIYCVGFQELDMSANALLLGNCAKAKPWEEAVYKTLSSFESYELVNNFLSSPKMPNKPLVLLMFVCFCRFTQGNLWVSSFVCL